MIGIIKGGYKHILCLKEDGTVVAIGNNDYGQCDVTDWTEIQSIEVGSEHSVGLRYDGTVVAVGNNEYGQCNVKTWSNIKEIKAIRDYTVGLKYDGTVVAVGNNEYGQCNVGNIIAARRIYVTPVRAIIEYDDHYEMCGYEDGYTDFTELKDAYLIVPLGMHIIGQTCEDTVVATGWNDCGVCDVDWWDEIADVKGSAVHTIGLRNDGTVVATGDNEEGQCNVESWTDISSLFANCCYTVGIKKNNTVVGTSKSDELELWENICEICLSEAGGKYIVGVRLDGTLVCTAGDENISQEKLNGIQLFHSKKSWYERRKQLENNYATQIEEMKQWGKGREIQLKKALEEQRKLKQQQLIAESKRLEKEKIEKKRRLAGVCQHCGGTFKGFFTKTCSSCGRKRDY